MSIINLLPDDYIKRRIQRRANVLCTVLFLVVMGAVVAGAMVSETALRNTGQVLDRVNTEYEHASRMLAQLQELQNQRGVMLEKAQATSTLQERLPRSFLLAVITNALPDGATLLSVDLASKRVIAKEPVTAKKTAKPARYVAGAKKTSNAEPAAPPNVQIEVSGLATTDVDVAKFIANLARCPLAASVDLVFSQEKLIDKVPFREFEVKVELKPNVDVIDVVGPTARQDGRLAELARAED